MRIKQSDPVDRENILSFNPDGSILFDHSIILYEMTPEEITKEYIFLNSIAAQEKDSRYGVCMGLSTQRQVRLDYLEKYILSALSTEKDRQENAVVFVSGDKNA